MKKKSEINPPLKKVHSMMHQMSCYWFHSLCTNSSPFEKSNLERFSLQQTYLVLTHLFMRNYRSLKSLPLRTRAQTVLWQTHFCAKLLAELTVKYSRNLSSLCTTVFVLKTVWNNQLAKLCYIVFCPLDRRICDSHVLTDR